MFDLPIRACACVCVCVCLCMPDKRYLKYGQFKLKLIFLPSETSIPNNVSFFITFKAN